MEAEKAHDLLSSGWGPGKPVMEFNLSPKPEKMRCPHSSRLAGSQKGANSSSFLFLLLIRVLTRVGVAPLHWGGQSAFSMPISSGSTLTDTLRNQD